MEKPSNRPPAATPAAPPPARRENWGSKIGVILAVSGSAVGLGNFLRFPGHVATWGGVFMVPYFISLLLLGIPICWAEWTMGRYGGARGHNSVPGIFSVLWPRPFSKYFGVLALFIPVVIYMYYVYVEAWCLGYALDYLRGSLLAIAQGAGPGEEVARYGAFFKSWVGQDVNGFPHGPMMLVLLFVFALNLALIYLGLNRGIEAFAKIAMPLLILCALVILARVLTLGTPDPAQPAVNINNALGYMWNPKLMDGSMWGALLNPELWLAASGQIFFSLSIGLGVILNYASYLRRDDDVVLSGLTASATNEFCEVCLGGLITVPVAFLFLRPENLNPDVLGSTFSLGFHVLPAVFYRMPLGQFFGGLWFFMLFLAAVTSSVSMLQPAIAFLEEGFGLRRRFSVTLLGLITAAGVLVVVYFSKNLLAIDTMDFWAGTVAVYLLAMIQVLIFSWVRGPRVFKAEMESGAEIRVPRLFWFVIKYVSPVYLLVIFVAWCWGSLPARFQAMAALAPDDRDSLIFVLGFLVLMLALFATLIYWAGQRWKRNGSPAGRY